MPGPVPAWAVGSLVLWASLFYLPMFLGFYILAVRGPRELVGLIGPNGAGKTTVFNMITGVYQPTEGQILFNGERLNGLKPYAITAKGIARTFQNIRLFPSLTVFDNVRAAFNLHLAHGPRHAWWRGAKLRAEEAEIEAKAIDLLKIFNLDRHRDDLD